MRRFRAAAAVPLLVLACGESKPEPTLVDPPTPAEVAPLVFEAAPEPPAPAPKRPGPLTVSVGACAAPDCPIVLTFSHPVVVPDLIPPAPTFLSFEPALPASFVWRTPSELVVQPDPGALSWGHAVQLSVEPIAALDDPEVVMAGQWSANVRVPYLVVGGKVAQWPVRPGSPRLVAFLDGATRQIGPGGVNLLYDQPVEPDEILASITALDAKGRRLKLRARRSDTDFGVPIEAAYLVNAHVEVLPAQGETVRLMYPSHEGEATAVKQRDLVVNKQLSVETFSLWEHDGRVPIVVHWQLRFNNPVSPDALQAALTVDPSPPELQISTWGTEATIRARFDPGTHHRLHIDGSLIDGLGNRLNEPVRQTFRTEDLPPELDVPGGPVVVERNDADLRVSGVNARNINARFHRFDSAASFVRALGRKVRRCREHDGIEAKSTGVFSPKWRAGLNERFEHTWRLPPSRLPGPGCLELTATGRGSHAQGGALTAAVLIQPSVLGATVKIWDGGVLAWVTRLTSARPVDAGLVALLDRRGQRIAERSTDAAGLAVFETPRVSDVRYLHASTADGDVFVPIEDKKLSQPWQYDLPAPVPGAPVLGASIFTDRGVYRPEESVRIALIARDRQSLRVPDDHMIGVTVSDPRGKQVLDRVVTVDRFGVADVELPLAEGAATGRYTITAKQDGRARTTQFQVEAYRVPTFEVKVSSSEGTWATGGSAPITIEGAYYHGGALAGRQVSHQVVRVPHRFAPEGLAGFVFNSPIAASLAGQIASGDARLDGQGAHRFAFTPDHPAAAGPMRYVVAANVTDVDRQSYAGRSSKVVHPAKWYIGLRPPRRRVVSSSEPIDVDVVVTDTAGKPVRGVKVDVGVFAVEHHTVTRWSAEDVERLNRAVSERVGSCSVKSRKSPRACRLPVQKAGHYRVHAVATDPDGKRVSTTFEITATGDQTIAWPRFDHERIDVIADRSSYAPGDVAKLVVKTPFARARGLLTLERDGIVETRTFEIDRDSPSIDVPIRAEHAPNVYASVVLVRPRVHGVRDATGFATGAPAFRMGYVALKVDPAAHRLAVNVAAPKTAHPKQRVDLELSMVDARGAPRAGQAVVMVVDEAVLAMTRYRTPDPIADLFAERALGVRTGSSRLDLPHARRARRELVFPGGDGSTDPLDGLPNQVRSFFESTAHFDPAVPIDANGNARVSFTLPDNLTTYRVMAIAVDAESGGGSSQAKLQVTKPLIVQPVLPRFVYPGDELVAEALVFNGTGAAGEVELSASFEGLVSSGEAVQRFDVGARGSKTGEYPVVASGEAVAKIRFAAKLAHRDVVQVEIPILDPGTKRVEVEQRRVADRTQLELTIPTDRIAGSERVSVAVSTTMLSELAGAVGYVMGYPNGCIEQTTSRAYPLVMLEELLDDIGVEVDRKKLKEYATAGIARLLSFQTSEGGLSYWPGGTRPHAFGTVFGLTALIEGKNKGYDVPDEALQKMADYLERTLAAGVISEEMPHGGLADGDTKALIVMTLGRLGRKRPGYVDNLWRNQQALTPFGMSMLAVAVREGVGDERLLEPMLAKIRSAAEERDAEAFFGGKAAGGWSFGSPLRTHAAALLAWAPTADSPMPSKLLAGLLGRKVNGMWGNTQENVYGIMSVAALARSADADGAPAMHLAVNGARISPKRMRVGTNRLRELTLDGAALAARPGAVVPVRVELANRGPSPMYLTVRTEYTQPLDSMDRGAKRRGFTVKRTYETKDGRALGTELPLGGVVQVRLRVDADTAQNYVALQDNLPAGLEPLNANLATTAAAKIEARSAEAKRALERLSYQEIRDSSVSFYLDEMPAGAYELVYLARATTAGSFLRPAASIEAMYAPQVSGRTAVDEVTVR